MPLEPEFPKLTALGPTRKSRKREDQANTNIDMISGMIKIKN